MMACRAITRTIVQCWFCIRPCQHRQPCLCEVVFFFFIQPNSARWHHSLAFKETASIQPPSVQIKTLRVKGRRTCIASSLTSRLWDTSFCSSVVMCKFLQIDNVMVYSATCHIIMTGLFAKRHWTWYGKTVHQLFDDLNPRAKNDNGITEYILCTVGLRLVKDKAKSMETKNLQIF